MPRFPPIPDVDLLIEEQKKHGVPPHWITIISGHSRVVITLCVLLLLLELGNADF
jgi:hypothetical protein